MNKLIKIITDQNAFQDRVDEITATTSFEEVKETMSDLKKVLNSDKNAVCICAPQIGKDLRMFVVKRSREGLEEDSRYKVFLNPIIVSKKGQHASRETSLSFPNKQFIVFRANEIHVAYQEYDGRPNSESFVGAYAEVVQQMIEMLDGITLLDYALDLDDVGGPDEFDKASNKDKIALLTMYADSLRQRNSDAQSEIKSDEKLKEIDDTIRFTTGLLDGSIVPLDKDGNEIKENIIMTPPKTVIKSEVEEN